MNVLVIPSNRPDCLTEFFDSWGDRGGWDQSIVIEDNKERSFITTADHHYTWCEIGKMLGEDAWIFSKRDSAIRCFGFLVAWWLGADHVLTLDDDCFPQDDASTPPFLDRHVLFMNTHPRWVSTVPGLRVRGLPYQDTGASRNVAANVGLWTNHPDIDAVSSLTLMAEKARPSYGLSHRNWLIPHRQYAPICGMNLCIRRDALPLFYFPLQGEGQPYRRFDDIWAGVIAKRVADHLGWSISVGEPFVEHRRASDPFVNLEKEAPGIAANETFWQLIDSLPLTSTNAIGAVFELGCGLETAPTVSPYFNRLGKALQVWARLLAEKPPGL